MDPSPSPAAGTASAPAPAPAPAWHEGLITKGSDGSERMADFATWKDRAPAPLRDFITANMTAARAKTEGMVKVPGAAAPPEEWDAVWKALGRPDNPEGYGIKAPDKLPDGVSWDDATAGKFGALAHQIGLTPSQVRALQEFQIGHVGEQSTAARTAMAAQIEQEQTDLRAHFGARLTDAAAGAQKLARDFGLNPAVFDPASGDFWGTDALKWADSLASRFTKLTSEDRGSNSGASTTQGGYEYAKAVSTDTRHPDYDAYRRGDPAVVKRVNDGWKQMPRSG